MKILVVALPKELRQVQLKSLAAFSNKNSANVGIVNDALNSML
jgi:hypothetical protein